MDDGARHWAHRGRQPPSRAAPSCARAPECRSLRWGAFAGLSVVRPYVGGRCVIGHSRLRRPGRVPHRCGAAPPLNAAARRDDDGVDTARVVEGRWATYGCCCDRVLPCCYSSCFQSAGKPRRNPGEAQEKPRRSALSLARSFPANALRKVASTRGAGTSKDEDGCEW
eukprot:gene13503-biopygen2289